jgi:MoxR-like ATPase
MILAAKALAVLDGRTAISAEDVREAAPLVLRHRILPNYTAAGDGIDAREIVRRLLDEVKEPSYASV